MVVEEIINQNELIAEFIGCEKVMDHGRIYYKGEFINRFNKYGYLRNNELKFHIDWNWIKEVVDKVAAIGNYGDCERELNIRCGYVCNHPVLCEISIHYENIINFIKWYNESEIHKNKQ